MSVGTEKPARREPPAERQAITHRFEVGGHKGYITVGFYEDGSPCELSLVLAKEGSTVSGLARNFAEAVSFCLQYGVPLQDLVDKFSSVRFEPSGRTSNPAVPQAHSIVDYVFRWMQLRFLTPQAEAETLRIHAVQAPRAS